MRVLRTLEKIYVVISMLFLASGLIPRTLNEGDLATAVQQAPADKYGQIVVFGLLIPLLLVHWRKIVHGLMHSGWIIALCALVLASAAWSYNWRFTAQRGILVVATTLFAVYVATCFDWDEQLNMFGWLSVISVVGSAFLAVFVPYYGLSQDIHQGAVKGLFPHKNMLGRQMAFALLTLWLARPRFLPNWFRLTAIVAAAMLLLLSNAVTAILSFLACLALYPVIYVFRLSRRRTLPLWVPLTPVFAMGLLLVLANFGSVLQAAGRSTTLTGRSAIWHAVLSAIASRPWLGYGHDVFWGRWNMDLAKVNYVLGFRPPHAHNGYLDLLLSVGVVGLLVFLGGFVTALFRAGRAFAANEIHGAKWPLFALLFFAAFNLGESNILRGLTFLWIPYVSIYVSLALMEARSKVPVFAESPLPDPQGYLVADEGSSASGVLPGYGV